MGNFILSSILKNYDFYQMHSVWDQWQTIAQKSSHRLSKIIKHRKNASILGQIHHSIQIENLEKCFNILQFRKTYLQSSIVGIHGVYLPNNQKQTSFNFCGQFENYLLVTQHMPFCLSDIGLIEFSNGIYILKNAFSAAKLIKQKLNITTLYDENMIFFDNQNKCKIWINEDISQNRVIHGTQASQLESIFSIFAAVQMKIKYSQNLENYFQLKSQFELKTFMQAINFVNNFQSQSLKLRNISESSRISNISSINFNIISQVKTQKVKKSLSSKKKNFQDKKIYNFSSIKNLHYNLQLQSGQSENFSNIQTPVTSKFKQNIPLKLKNRQTGQSNNFLQNKLSVNNFLKQGDLKRQQLKKRTIKRNFAQEKLHDYKVKEINVPQKPLSTLSTNQQSFQIYQSQRFQRSQMYEKKLSEQNSWRLKMNEVTLYPRPQNVKTENSSKGFFNISKGRQSQYSIINKIQEPKQINNCGKNINKFQNIHKGNEKFSLSDYQTRLKENVSLPFF